MSQGPGSYNNQIAQGISQLAQVRAAIEEAAEVFGRKDEAGRTPIVVVPKRQNRIRWGLVIFGIVIILVGFFAAGASERTGLGVAGFFFGILFILFGLLRSLYIQVPEGANALLSRGGKHIGVVGAGLHFIA